jgi:hypothetical protein
MRRAKTIRRWFYIDVERNHDDIVLAVAMACWAVSSERFDPEPWRIIC